MPFADGVRLLQCRIMLGFALLASIASVSAWPSRRKLQGRFLHISGLAGTFGAEKTDCDSPYILVNVTLKWIEDNVRDQVDFVIWTGDSARHDSDEDHPRHEADVVKSNRIIADKIFDTFSTSNGKLSIPVVPTFGNNDFLPHNVMFAGPNKWFQTYTHIWRQFIPEEQRHTFGLGGWFSVEVIPDHLAVFSLNTMFFFDRNPAVDGCAHPDEPGYQQLDWLRVQLQIIRDRGMKAILMGHVPPARTDSKQLWDETCWQKYTLWLKQYRDVVTASLYGHMNIDHFLLQDAADLQPSLGAEQLTTRNYLEDEMWIESKEDYLQELRDRWAALPSSVIHGADDAENDEETDGRQEDSQKGGKKKGKKKHKGKYHDIGGKHAERFQLTFISPSVVPNYFPTIRVMEYNTTGLEDTPVWMDSSRQVSLPSDYFQNAVVELEHLDAHRIEELKKNKKGKSKPGRKPPGDHNLVIPEGPPKKAAPGPAYLPQPLSLTGYTQYFANLTHINDDIPDEVDGAGWRQGEHDHKEPKHGAPRPLSFEYQVEYSTFNDKFYKLPDLTMRSYLKLAYRMGQKIKKTADEIIPSEFVDDDWFEGEDGQADETDAATNDAQAIELGQEGEIPSADIEDVGELGKKKKKKKKKNKKKEKEKNKIWLHFLQRAFVGTVPLNELR
ncbi:Endopolyphosphatase [Escovopsis weberi]|uniref:Endopolyphosphatase n=1 Tax=Escovopsis weberi TaxID=150374 RepID=A0A0M8N5Z5_ESCWE|nr:Endopolyphosphatase [Escovopsis weberi]